MRFLLAREACRRDRVEEALVTAGFHRSSELARRGPRRATAWNRGREMVVFETDMRSGHAFFRIDARTPDGAPLDDGALEELVSGITAVERPDVTLTRLGAETSDAARVRPLLALGHLAGFDDHGIPLERLGAVLRPCLRAASHGLRAAAVEVVLEVESPAFDDAVAGLREDVPELAWVEETWGRVRAMQREHEAAERGKADRENRWSSLEARLTAGDFAEVLAITEEQREERRRTTTFWRARALAEAGLAKTAETSGDARAARRWEGAFAAAAWWALDPSAEAEAHLAEAVADLPSRGDAWSVAPAVELARALERDGELEVAARALGALAERAEAHRAELGFLAQSLLVGGATTRDKSAAARPFLETFAQAFPASLAGHQKLGFVRLSVGDFEGALASYARAAELAAAPASGREDLERFEHDARGRERSFQRPTPMELWGELAYATGFTDALELGLVAVERALALPAEDDAARTKRLELLRLAALRNTKLLRHDDAVAAYRAAIAAEADTKGAEPEPVMRFNLACELAKTGQAEPALLALGEAVTLDEGYAEQALDDDYFESIWDSPAFARAISPPSAEPSREAASRARSRALASHYRGEDESVLLAHRAVAEALATGDDELTASALTTFGTILTYRKSPERGARVLRETLPLAERVGEPGLLAEAWHQLGAALHAASEQSEAPRWDEALHAYQEALAIREREPSISRYLVAVSLGDMARLESSRGRPTESLRILDDAAGRMRAFLAASPDPDDALDASVNLALLLGNAVPTARAAGAPWSEVLERAGAAVAWNEQLVAEGRRVPAGSLGRLRTNLAAATSMEGASADGALPLLDRITVLEFPDPAVRATRIYFARLVRGVQELRAAGVSDPELARGFSAGIRAEPLPPPMAEHPAFANLAEELARRLTAPTNLVMIAMSLELVESGAQPMEEALRSLESFAVANAEGYTEDDLDDEGDDDDLDDDEDLEGDDD